MKEFLFRFLRYLTLILCACFLVLLFLSYLGLRVNITTSLAKGVYWTVNKEPEVGDFVAFCLDENTAKVAYERRYITYGFCPGGYSYLMKQILAAKNDVITINDSGVYVNNAILPHSKPIDIDGNGDLLSVYKVNNEVIKEGFYLVMTNINPYSFDSRYYGLIHFNSIKSVVKPIYTW